MGGKRHPLEIYRASGRPFSTLGESPEPAPQETRRRRPKTRPPRRRPESTVWGKVLSRISRPSDSSSKATSEGRKSRSPATLRQWVPIALVLVLALGIVYTGKFVSQRLGDETGVDRTLKSNAVEWPDRLHRWWVQVASGSFPGNDQLGPWFRQLQQLRGALEQAFPGAETQLFQVGEQNDEILLCTGARGDRRDPWLQELLEWAQTAYPELSPRLVRLPEQDA